jgi:hypothetical protein
VDTAVEELFAEFGSDVLAVTVAVLLERELALKVVAFTFMVITAMLPTVRELMVHDTVVVAAV